MAGWKCLICGAYIDESYSKCQKCGGKGKPEDYEFSHEEIKIDLGDVTFSRWKVGRSKTGKKLWEKGNIGRLAIDCEHLPAELNDALVNFVRQVCEAKEETDEGQV